MKIYIYPYSSASESAKLLAERLGAKRIRLQNSEYIHSDNNLVINWGNSNCPHPCLNPGKLLWHTVDKLRFFRLMTRSGFSGLLPRYWVYHEDIPDEAFPVFCRTETQGHDGSGIVIAKDRTELTAAHLYTQAIRGGTEFRVTVFKGYGVTDIQTKLPRAGVPIGDTLIKTYSNGYGFQRKPVEPHTYEMLERLASDVLDATGLDFCGIDVIVTPSGKPYVLEVNSAMGLEGEALERFAIAVESHIRNRNSLAPAEAQEEPEEDFLLAAVREQNWAEVIKIAAGRIG